MAKINFVIDKLYRNE